jgi:hypothetical protein
MLAMLTVWASIHGPFPATFGPFVMTTLVLGSWLKRRAPAGAAERLMVN